MGESDQENYLSFWRTLGNVQPIYARQSRTISKLDVLNNFTTHLMGLLYSAWADQWHKPCDINVPAVKSILTPAVNETSPRHDIARKMN